MGKIPQELRKNIANNIRECRKKKFPGRGGAKTCAQAFGVSPQQWSPWETGKRVPDEARLSRLAEFFSVSVEYLRRDNSAGLAGHSVDALLHPDHTWPRHERPRHPPRRPEPTNPGSPESFYWLADWLITTLLSRGLTVSVKTRDQQFELLLQEDLEPTGA